MRPIKFRAWHPKKKEWIEFRLGDLCYNSDEGLINLDGWEDTVSFEDLQHWSQFTGLLDKNGVEIFEDDIIRVVAETEPPYNEGTWLVQYRGSSFDLHRIDSPFNISKQLDAWNSHSLEVIGNIYENPELLTSQT